MTPDRSEGKAQDELARSGLSGCHQLNVWGWNGRAGYQNASRLLQPASGRPVITSRWSVNRSDLIVYDFRFCPVEHWLAEVACLYAGLLCITSQQLAQIPQKLANASLGLAVEGEAPERHDLGDLPILQLNWPVPLPPAPPRSRRGERPRLLVIFPPAWDVARLQAFLPHLAGLPCHLRLVYFALEGAQPQRLGEHVSALPRRFLKSELAGADVAVQLGEPGTSQVYFDRLELLAAGCPSLLWPTHRADWETLIGRVQHLLACPWELQQLAEEARASAKQWHSLGRFTEKLTRFARSSAEWHLRRARVMLGAQIERLSETVVVDRGRQLLGELLSPRRSPAQVASPSSHPRVAYLSPLPPERSGVSVYSTQLLQPFCERAQVHLFARGNLLPRELAGRPLSIYPYQAFLARDERAPYDRVVYHLGNDYRYHQELIQFALRRPGTVVLHDTHLGSAMRAMYPEQAEYEDQLSYSLGGRAAEVVGEVRAGRRSPLSLLQTMFNRRIVEASTGVIVHSQWDRDQVLEASPGSQAKVFVAPLCTPLVDQVTPLQRSQARTRLEIGEDAFVIASFGFIEVNKKVESIVQNLGPFLSRHPQALLVLVGRLAEAEYGRQIQKLIDDSEVSGQIRVTGYLRHSDYELYLRSCDLGIQFRRHFLGGGALSINQSMAYGIPTMVTSEGPFLEYPEEVVIHVRPAQEANLSALVEECYARPEATRALGQRARDYMRERFSPQRCAASYAQILGLQP